MIGYMGKDITREFLKPKIISIPNEENKDVFANFYSDLALKGDHESFVKFNFIKRAFELLEEVPPDKLPEDSVIFGDFEIIVGNKSYVNRLGFVKDLRILPVYEMRISLKAFNWYFRATFFPKEHKGQMYYCFVYPFEKDPYERFDPTDHYRDKTFSVYQDIEEKQNFFEYID